MKNIFTNNYINILIAEEVAKDFEYLEDFLNNYCEGCFEDVKTLEELSEVISDKGLDFEYIESLTPIYYYDIKKDFRELVDSAKIYDVMDYIKDYHGSLELIVDFDNFDIMDFKRNILYMNIERFLYIELCTLLEVAKIENK